jgi:hypothetical protein
MLKQINIFVDNKPGKLRKIAEILYKNDIDIKAVTIQDRTEFGMVKLLVSNPEKTNLLLQDNGFASAIKNVLAVMIDDKPGGLFRLTDFFERNSINVIDGYSYTVHPHRSAVWCSEVQDLENAIRMLNENGFQVLSGDDLCEL